VACGEDSSRDAALNAFWKTQKTQSVRDLGSRATDSLGELLLSDSKVREKLLVCGCFFEGIEVCAVQVLEQGITQHVLVGCALDDCGNRCETQMLARSKATFAHDQFVLGSTLNGTDERPNDYRLENTDLADRNDQLRKLFFTKFSPRLARVRNNVERRETRKTGARNRAQLVSRDFSPGEEHINGALFILVR
jgi:hypothetical protein